MRPVWVPPFDEDGRPFEDFTEDEIGYGEVLAGKDMPVRLMEGQLEDVEAVLTTRG